MSTQVAIVMRDTLAAMGLQHLLETTFDVAVALLDSVDDLAALRDAPTCVVTDPWTYVTHINTLLPRRDNVVVVGHGPCSDGTPCHYIDQTASINDLVEQFKAYIDRRADQRDGDVLSQREIEVLRLVAAGKINKEIADTLNISINTVQSHRKNITAKLGIKSVSGLSFYAMMNGLLKS